MPYGIQLIAFIERAAATHIKVRCRWLGAATTGAMLDSIHAGGLFIQRSLLDQMGMPELSYAREEIKPGTFVMLIVGKS
jgi:hypothetical protein